MPKTSLNTSFPGLVARNVLADFSILVLTDYTGITWSFNPTRDGDAVYSYLRGNPRGLVDGEPKAGKQVYVTRMLANAPTDERDPFGQWGFRCYCRDNIASAAPDPRFQPPSTDAKRLFKSRPRSTRGTAKSTTPS